MNTRPSQVRIKRIIYGLMVVVIGWQAYRIARHLTAPTPVAHNDYNIVSVSGNVEHPGRYRVPDGTSRFELLRVAGVRPTSDIMALNLTSQLEESENLSVGSLASPASIPHQVLAAQLEFFLGNIAIENQAGNVRPREAGLALMPGDRVTTEQGAQAEISMGPYTRIDIDASSELVLDEIPRGTQTPEWSVFQRKGSCWYRVVYASKEERMKVVTEAATATAAGTGADFMVELGADFTRIHALEGQVTVQRSESDEVINLVGGQTLAILANRPFQVTRTASDISATRIFADLQKKRGDLNVQNAPINFIFCTLPDNYYFISLRYDRTEARIISIPGKTSVSDLGQGFNTLNQAFLLGGGLYVQSIIEQLLSTRVERYCALDKSGLLKIVSSLGSLDIDVDHRAARFMNLDPGHQPLDANQVYTFLQPRISGLADTRLREEKVLRMLFGAVRGGDILLTSTIAQRAIGALETNFTPSEIMNAYTKFRSIRGWGMRMHRLPGIPERSGATTVFRPDPTAARKLLFGEG